jgi:hypothetical protein
MGRTWKDSKFSFKERKESKKQKDQQKDFKFPDKKKLNKYNYEE